mgnify:CR=1 FL=1
MKYNDLTIFCDIQVEFQEVYALTVCILKGSHCIFGTLPASPAMGAIQLHWSTLVENFFVKIIISLQAGAELKEKTVGQAAIDAAT